MTPGVASVRDALGAAADALAAAGVESPGLDAEVMLAAATGAERAVLVADGSAALEPAAGRAFGEMVRRRLRREPVAYIVGRRGFRHIELAVDSRVLIPRPETELLVELALELGPHRVLDVGTGSGAVALAVADELAACEVVATDTSPTALDVARENGRRLGLGDRVAFVEGTLPAGPGPSGFDLILANLPYVAERDWAGLEPEVTQWEPREALLAGPDGLDAYRALIPRLPGRTSSRIAATSATSAVVGLEVGEGQANAVAGLLQDAGFEGIEVRKDLAGIERVVVGRLAGDAASMGAEG